MKILLALLAVTLTTFLATVPAGGPQEEDLKVIYNLSGILQGLENKELAVTFSDDMLPLGGKRDGSAIVRITPQVKGEFTWRGNRTLAFKPDPRFRYSTTYTAVIPAGTRSLAGKVLPREIRWQWSTPQAYPIEIKVGARDYFSQLTPGEKLDNPVWVKDAITLRFNQPVSAAGAKSFFVLQEAKRWRAGSDPDLAKNTRRNSRSASPRDLKRGMLYQLHHQKGLLRQRREHRHGQGLLIHLRHGAGFRLQGRSPPGPLSRLALLLADFFPTLWLNNDPLIDQDI